MANGKDFFHPSFEEIAFMIWYIKLYEEGRYPQIEGYLGQRKVNQFLSEIAAYFPQGEAEMREIWEEIRKKLQLPGKNG